VLTTLIGMALSAEHNRSGTRAPSPTTHTPLETLLDFPYFMFVTTLMHPQADQFASIGEAAAASRPGGPHSNSSSAPTRAPVHTPSTQANRPYLALDIRTRDPNLGRFGRECARPKDPARTGAAMECIEYMWNVCKCIMYIRNMDTNNNNK